MLISCTPSKYCNVIQIRSRLFVADMRKITMIHIETHMDL